MISPQVIERYGIDVAFYDVLEKIFRDRKSFILIKTTKKGPVTGTSDQTKMTYQQMVILILALVDQYLLYQAMSESSKTLSIQGKKESVMNLPYYELKISIDELTFYEEVGPNKCDVMRFDFGDASLSKNNVPEPIDMYGTFYAKLAQVIADVKEGMVDLKEERI